MRGTHVRCASAPFRCPSDVPAAVPAMAQLVAALVSWLVPVSGLFWLRSRCMHFVGVCTSRHQMSPSFLFDVHQPYVSSVSIINRSTTRTGVSSLEFGRESSPPAMRDEAELSMLLPACSTSERFPANRFLILKSPGEMRFECPSLFPGMAPHVCARVGAWVCMDPWITPPSIILDTHSASHPYHSKGGCGRLGPM